jgi:hypothetical protein
MIAWNGKNKSKKTFAVTFFASMALRYILDTYDAR